MRPFAALLVALGLMLAAAAWSAPRIPAVSAPATVRPGEEYVTALPELPAEVEECELFLVLEDGSHRAIRLTPEREADEGPIRWRMPHVPAGRARLVLRAGGRFGETESAPSASFAIVAPAPARDELLRGAPELAWHFGAGAAAAPAALLPPGATTIAAAASTLVAVEPQRDAGPEAPALNTFTLTEAAATCTTTPGALARSRRPAFVPLRN